MSEVKTENGTRDRIMERVNFNSSVDVEFIEIYLRAVSFSTVNLRKVQPSL